MRTSEDTLLDNSSLRCFFSLVLVLLKLEMQKVTNELDMPVNIVEVTALSRWLQPMLSRGHVLPSELFNVHYFLNGGLASDKRF